MSKKISFKRPSNDMSNHITNAVMLLVIIINTKMVFLSSLAVKPPTLGGGYKATLQPRLHTEIVKCVKLTP